MRDQVDSDITFYLYSAIEFIEDAIRINGFEKTKVLIHCFKGNSRSAAILAGYLMWKYSYTCSQALNTIREKRGFIDPNIGFVG